MREESKEGTSQVCGRVCEGGEQGGNITSLRTCLWGRRARRKHNKSEDVSVREESKEGTSQVCRRVCERGEQGGNITSLSTCL